MLIHIGTLQTDPSKEIGNWFDHPLYNTISDWNSSYDKVFPEFNNYYYFNNDSKYRSEYAK